MSIVIILGAATLLAAPLEAVTGRRTARKARPYRKPNPPHRRKKSPHTFHSREL